MCWGYHANENHIERALTMTVNDHMHDSEYGTYRLSLLIDTNRVMDMNLFVTGESSVCFN